MAKPKKSIAAPDTAAEMPAAVPAALDDVKRVAEQPAASDETASSEARPPQGITIRYMETGTRADFHHFFYGRAGVPDVRRIDPESLRGAHVDPYLVDPDGHVMQVRCDHAAQLLECSPTGGTSGWRLATDDEVAANRGGK